MKPDVVELTAGALTLGYSGALNRALPEFTYVPSNLLAAGALLGLARACGCDADDLGLSASGVGRGLAAGAVGSAAACAGLVAAMALPKTRGLFVEERDETRTETVYHALVRIPVGTALAEELIFRGALLGILARRRPWWQAAAVSSALFGVWHVLPTHDSLDRSRAAVEVRGRPWARTAAVVGTVAVTTVAGFGLSLLRMRSRSIAAPVAVHAAVNLVGYLGGGLLARRDR